jgi:hypothetical protein
MPLTGNVLVHFRGITYEGGLPVDQHARVVEVTHQVPATVVFEVSVFDPGLRIRISRAEKIASLYAAGVGVCGNNIVDPIEQCDPPGVTPACDCCGEHPAPGCGNPTCEAAVCAADVACCGSTWDATCAARAGTIAECVACCAPREACTAACLTDVDGDGFVDDDDGCVTSPNPGGATALFDQSVLARAARDGFDWPFDAEVSWVRGSFTSSSDIAAFVVDAGGTVSGTALVDLTLPSPRGTGLWYLIKPDCIDASWISGGPGEAAGRDASLP